MPDWLFPPRCSPHLIRTGNLKIPGATRPPNARSDSVSVKTAGVDQGLKDAQYVFEAVMDDLAPMLREMPNLGS